MMTSAWPHAPTLFTPCSSSLSHSPSNSQLKRNLSSMAAAVRIAVVGDVHDDWNLREDTQALELLQNAARFGAVYRQVLLLNADFVPSESSCQAGFHKSQLLFPALYVTFKCDFGNENVELVRSIANLDFPKAVILGNHDAWSTRKFSDKKKDAVQLQLECLGGQHVGYRRLDFPQLKLSVVGGRPFSCGGDRMYRKTLLKARYGIHSINGSAERIFKAASGAPEEHSVILLAHNGPTGLGSNMNDICGRDWVRGGGDHGDPDLAHAISQLKEKTTHTFPLVVFGHMHKELAFGSGPRKMIVVGDDNTVYLNGAIVPRIIKLPSEQGTCSGSPVKNETHHVAPESEGTLRAFTVIDIMNGSLEKIAETWVSVIGDKTTLKEEHILFSIGPRVSELSL